VNKFVNTALIAVALLAGAAQAQTATERTRAEVIAELKAAVESGEQQAMAMQMEGVGTVLPKRVERPGAKLAVSKSTAETKNLAEVKPAAETKKAVETQDLAFKAGLIPRL
jgi:hypothetical protein